MDINDRFDGMMKSINQFGDEIAEERVRHVRVVEPQRAGTPESVLDDFPIPH